MSQLQDLLNKYEPVISRAANIIDTSQAGGMAFTPTQLAFIGQMQELLRLATLGAPEFLVIIELEEAHRQAQAVITEAGL